MKKILFVCLGNICRSPAAEGVMIKLAQNTQMSDKIYCDSAGTSAYHVGEPADGRMARHASMRGYELTSRSRRFDATKDFEDFDYIITMDDHNYSDVTAQDKNSHYTDKVIKMSSLCTEHNITGVPDPYVGGEKGFELVMDIVEDGCKALLERIKKEIQ